MVCGQNLSTDYISGLLYNTVNEMDILSFTNIQIPFKSPSLSSLPRKLEKVAELRKL